MTFTVLVYEAEEDEGGYWAEVPELPGCVSQGESLDELRANITEAILMCLEAHEQDEGVHAPRKLFTWDMPIDRIDGGMVPA